MRLTPITLAALAGAGLAVTAFFVGLAGFAAARVGVEMSLHGWIAISLGVSLTILVSVMLIGLLIHSRRAGYDQDAHDMSRLMMGERPEE